MKICVWPNTPLKQIPQKTTQLHFGRPIPKKQLSETLAKRTITQVTVSKSTFVRLPETTIQLLTDHGIGLFIQQNPGKPLSIGMKQILEVVERYKDHQPLRKIEQFTGIPKSTVHYLIKYAKRSKTKKGKIPVYLK